MAEPLRDSFLADVRCSEAEAAVLAHLARERLGSFGAEDTDEDLVVRLRDPRTYGDFVSGILGDHRLSSRTRTALVERAFDLLPVPRSEGDVILVESRAPRNLLALAGFLAAQGDLTVLHAMHLTYAVFLDRSLIMAVGRDVRTAVLDAVIVLPEASERLKVLYACMHLGSVPESEAQRDLRTLLGSRAPTASAKRSVASTVSEDDGGVGRLATLAMEEGLLPSEAADPHDPSVIANIPRMPATLAASGRRWLALHGAD